MAKDQIVDNTDMQFINKANILIEALAALHTKALGQDNRNQVWRKRDG